MMDVNEIITGMHIIALMQPNNVLCITVCGLHSLILRIIALFFIPSFLSFPLLSSSFLSSSIPLSASLYFSRPSPSVLFYQTGNAIFLDWNDV